MSNIAKITVECGDEIRVFDTNLCVIGHLDSDGDYVVEKIACMKLNEDDPILHFNSVQPRSFFGVLRSVSSLAPAFKALRMVRKIERRKQSER